MPSNITICSIPLNFALVKGKQELISKMFLGELMRCKGSVSGAITNRTRAYNIYFEQKYKAIFLFGQGFKQFQPSSSELFWVQGVVSHRTDYLVADGFSFVRMILS